MEEDKEKENKCNIMMILKINFLKKKMMQMYIVNIIQNNNNNNNNIEDNDQQINLDQNKDLVY